MLFCDSIAFKLKEKNNESPVFPKIVNLSVKSDVTVPQAGSQAVPSNINPYLSLLLLQAEKRRTSLRENRYVA